MPIPTPPPARPSILTSRNPAATPAQPIPVRSPTPPPVVDIKQAVSTAFPQPITLPPLGMAYRALLVLLLASGVVLPVLYVGLALSVAVSGVAWLAWAHDSVHGIRSGVGTVGIAVGLWIVAFTMLAPVIKRHRTLHRPSYVVTPSTQPLLLELVECLAKGLGAPVPDQVELIQEPNAAVKFHRDFRILLIGLPLFAVLNATELTGILAHELGHMRQGWARRALLMCLRIQQWFMEAQQAPEHWLESEANRMLKIGLFRNSP